MTVNDYVWYKIHHDKKVASKVHENPSFSESAYDAAFKINYHYHDIIITLLFKPGMNVKQITDKLESEEETAVSKKKSATETYNYYKKIERLTQAVQVLIWMNCTTQVLAIIFSLFYNHICFDFNLI